MMNDCIEMSMDRCMSDDDEDDLFENENQMSAKSFAAPV